MKALASSSRLHRHYLRQFAVSDCPLQADILAETGLVNNTLLRCKLSFKRLPLLSNKYWTPCLCASPHCSAILLRSAVRVFRSTSSSSCYNEHFITHPLHLAWYLMATPEAPDDKVDGGVPTREATQTRSSVHLTVKAPRGVSWAITVPSVKSTVADIKAVLSSPSATPADRQRLVYRGHMLKDEDTLEKCGIEQDSVLHMVAKLLPGEEDGSDSSGSHGTGAPSRTSGAPTPPSAPQPAPAHAHGHPQPGAPQMQAFPFPFPGFTMQLPGMPPGMFVSGPPPPPGTQPQQQTFTFGIAPGFQEGMQRPMPGMPHGARVVMQMAGPGGPIPMHAFGGQLPPGFHFGPMPGGPQTPTGPTPQPQAAPAPQQTTPPAPASSPAPAPPTPQATTVPAPIPASSPPLVSPSVLSPPSDAEPAPIAPSPAPSPTTSEASATSGAQSNQIGQQVFPGVPAGFPGADILTQVLQGLVGPLQQQFAQAGGPSISATVVEIGQDAPAPSSSPSSATPLNRLLTTLQEMPPLPASEAGDGGREVGRRMRAVQDGFFALNPHLSYLSSQLLDARADSSSTITANATRLRGLENALRHLSAELLELASDVSRLQG
jgi:hypothetical protein